MKNYCGDCGNRLSKNFDTQSSVKYLCISCYVNTTNRLMKEYNELNRSYQRALQLIKRLETNIKENSKTLDQALKLVQKNE